MTELTTPLPETISAKRNLLNKISPAIGSILCPVVGVTYGIAGFAEARPGLVVAGAASLVAGAALLTYSYNNRPAPTELDNRGEL